MPEALGTPRAIKNRIIAVVLTAGSFALNQSDFIEFTPLPDENREIEHQVGRLALVQAEIDKASNGRMNGIYLGEFESTCYALTGTTASGRPAGPGSIAVDPNVIELGTRLYVEGYGEGIAADTGGAIKGKIVDVWQSTDSSCMEWGRHQVDVWELN